MRRLLETRRLIPLDRVDEYIAGWERVRSAVGAAGGRAWIFRGSARQDQFVEFLEWHDEPLPLPEREGVQSARLDLDERFGAGHADEWEEVQTP